MVAYDEKKTTKSEEWGWGTSARWAPQQMKLRSSAELDHGLSGLFVTGVSFWSVTKDAYWCPRLWSVGENTQGESTGPPLAWVELRALCQVGWRRHRRRPLAVEQR